MTPQQMDTKNLIELSSRRNILDGFLVTRIPWYGNLEQTGPATARLYRVGKLK